MKSDNIFTCRLPRNKEEIATCIQMLLDSPFYDPIYQSMKKQDMVDAWEDICRKGYGSIVIFENRDFDDFMIKASLRKNHAPYTHHFISCIFDFYPSRDLMRELIQSNEIRDGLMHFTKLYINYLRDPNSNSMPVQRERVGKANNTTKETGGNRNVSIHVLNRNIDVIHPKVVSMIAKYTRRTWETLKSMFSGMSFDSFLMYITGNVTKHFFILAGNKELKECPGNDQKRNEDKKFMFCIIKNEDELTRLGIPECKHNNLRDHYSHPYYFLVDYHEPVANLSVPQQQTCYLLTLGYSVEQISDAIFEDRKTPLVKRKQCVNNYQYEAARKLYDSGYTQVGHIDPVTGKLKSTRDELVVVIRENFHEVKGVYTPLYPFPENHFLP